MKKRTIIGVGLCLMLSASGFADSFTRDSGDSSWSNLNQWNYYDGSNYVNAIAFPTSSDTILLNGGRILTVDTNAFAGTIRLPNGSSDAFLELPAAGTTLAVSTLNVGRDGYAGNGSVNQSAGSIVATTLSLQPGETKTASYSLSGGTVSATSLEIGKSSVSATGTATFVQSGGTVISSSITVGGSGSGTYEISGGNLDATGTLAIITNGQLSVAGTSAFVTATTLDTQPGSQVLFSLVAYSVTGIGSSFQCLENAKNPDFFLYAHPVTDSFPVFEIIEDDGSRYLTWNPYANGIVKPYDGTMAGQRLLGFSMPSAGTNGTYAALSGLLPASNYFADGEILFVRTATPIETWRVEYFGFADDAGDSADAANPDSDELNNLGEYALGGNPTNGADIGYVPILGNAAGAIDYVHARRIGSEAELSYALQFSSNLLSNDWKPGSYIELPITGTLDADYEAVTNRIDTAGTTNEFIRLKVEAL